MRIVDKHRKDYYDSVQKYGHDDLQYVRTERIQYYDVPSSMATSYDAALLYISFCGSLHPCVKLGDVHYYSYEQLLKALGGVVSITFKTYKQFFRRDIVHFFNEIPQLEIPEPHVAAHVSVIFDYVSSTKQLQVIYEPVLYKYQFQKVFDSFYAFQKIEQYLSNQAAPEPKMVELSDKDRAIKAGHGGKYSFRKYKA